MINAYIVKPGVFKRMIAGKYPPIDMGIALCHLKIATKHLGKKSAFIFNKSISGEG
jgi:hypothetical protein